MARLLDVTVQRVYQLDAELQPIIETRGETMRARWYRPEVVVAYAASRGKVVDPSAPSPEALACAIASRVLAEYAGTSPFFVGVAPDNTESVRQYLRDIAKWLGEKK